MLNNSRLIYFRFPLSLPFSNTFGYVIKISIIIMLHPWHCIAFLKPLKRILNGMVYNYLRLMLGIHEISHGIYVAPAGKRITRIRFQWCTGILWTFCVSKSDHECTSWLQISVHSADNSLFQLKIATCSLIWWIKWFHLFLNIESYNTGSFLTLEFITFPLGKS
jgi:hypothetical protein